jgi:hypothetical protein
MKQQIALINSEGEIEQYFSPATTASYVDGAVQPNGLTLKFMDGNINLAEFLKTNILVDGEWVTREAKPDMYWFWQNGAWVFDSERFARDLRKERDRRLTMCDWTQVPDSPLSAEKKAEWATYRQELRDFPSIDESTLWSDIEWPVIPQ